MQSYRESEPNRENNLMSKLEPEDLMALWEAVLESMSESTNNAPTCLTEYQEVYGVCDMRTLVVTHMMPSLAISYEVADTLGYGDPFDLEFCPAFVAEFTKFFDPQDDLLQLTKEQSELIGSRIFDKYQLCNEARLNHQPSS